MRTCDQDVAGLPDLAVQALVEHGHSRLSLEEARRAAAAILSGRERTKEGTESIAAIRDGFLVKKAAAARARDRQDAAVDGQLHHGFHTAEEFEVQGRG